MPEAIAHYKILEPLGSGGLGDVFCRSAVKTVVIFALIAAVAAAAWLTLWR
jgi:hypothetical protein